MKEWHKHLAVTANYWAFTLTDGALRMLVVLYFHQLGYNGLEIAMLFLFYEFFGVLTNLFGGWIGSLFGLKRTLYAGMVFQVGALGMLVAPDTALNVVYVMIAQAFSGIGKDLVKLSAKSSVKLLTKSDGDGRLFKFVGLLTGSKNALKGVGFFIGAWLLSMMSFQDANMALGIFLAVSALGTFGFFPAELGKSKGRTTFGSLFAKEREINVLSAARFFLFGSRDIWFVVGLPLYLEAVHQFTHMQVGGFLALWVIVYGFWQGIAPKLFKRWPEASVASGKFVMLLCGAIAVFPLVIWWALHAQWFPLIVLLVGLILFGFVFALNSSLHSFLILYYSDDEKVAKNVGFYYMANAGGRLVGTLLSGGMYVYGGIEACLLTSAGFVITAALISKGLPDQSKKLSASSAA